MTDLGIVANPWFRDCAHYGFWHQLTRGFEFLIGGNEINSNFWERESMNSWFRASVDLKKKNGKTNWGKFCYLHVRFLKQIKDDNKKVRGPPRSDNKWGWKSRMDCDQTGAPRELQLQIYFRRRKRNHM